MAIVDHTLVERRTGTQNLIKKLTDERTEMLVLFCRVAGLEPYTAGKPARALLQEFCQVLVDYIAAGHFALYGRILDGNERRKDVIDLAERLYPGIARTTDAAVEFNDRYDSEEDSDLADTLSEDLSSLGEELAGRIELEDQLIAALQPPRRKSA
jgi:regulator of sigma D